MSPWRNLLGRASHAQRAGNAATRARHASAPVANGDSGPLLDDDELRQIERLGLVGLDALTDGLTGEHAGRRRTQEIEFADYRGYTPGDDFRRIDWNAYARLGELFVKTGVAQEALTLSLLLDRSRSMDGGRPNKLRYARRLAAALGAVALQRHDAVRLSLLGDGRAQSGETLHGPAALATLLTDLDGAPVAAATGLRDSLDDYRHRDPSRGVVVLLSDLLAPLDQVEALGYLAMDGVQAVVLHVVDPSEADPPLGGMVELRDRETGDLVDLTVTPGLRRRYVARFAERAREVADACARYGLSYVRVSTSTTPTDMALTMLRREDVVRS